MRPTMLLRSAAAPTPFSAAHKSYVQSLYRRYLRNSLNWCIRRDIWRDRAIEIRAEFERQRNIRNPRELARVLAQAEAHLAANAHPDPYKCACSAMPRCDTALAHTPACSTNGRGRHEVVSRSGWQWPWYAMWCGLVLACCGISEARSGLFASVGSGSCCELPWRREPRRLKRPSHACLAACAGMALIPASVNALPTLC